MDAILKMAHTPLKIPERDTEVMPKVQKEFPIRANLSQKLRNTAEVYFSPLYFNSTHPDGSKFASKLG